MLTAFCGCFWLTDQFFDLTGIELFELTSRDTENGCGALETISDRQKTVALFVRGVRAGCIVVPEWEPRVRMRVTVSD